MAAREIFPLVRVTSRLMFVAAACALGIAAPKLALGNGDETAFRVSVFDCHMPVPTSFVLNTHEKGHISLFLRSDLESRRIYIGDYRGSLGDELLEVDSRVIDGLTVEQFRFRRATGDDRIDRVFRIQNGTQEVTIYGATDEFVDSLVNGCTQHKRPDLK